MMPSTLAKRNGISMFMLGFVAVTGACGERLTFDVVLMAPSEPDPFAQVARLRVSADLDRGVQGLGEVRWDQGPVVLPVVPNPRVQRIVIEGLDEAGRVVASGASPLLDLLASPPEQVVIDFSRIGVLSRWPGDRSPRRGGRAVRIGEHRWMAVGGLDERGCPRPDTEIFGPGRADRTAGPALPGGRMGDFTVLALTDGQVLVLGGEPSSPCGAVPTDPRRLDPRTGESVEGTSPGWPPGAAVAAISDSLVLAAGGWGPVTARPEVYGLDPRTFDSRIIGTLSIPRARSLVVPLDGQRALVLGGQTLTGTASALADASVFEPSRGGTLTDRIDLGGPTLGGAAVRTAAGSVVLVSPDPLRGGRAEVKTVVVKREQDIPLGDVTPVTVTTSSDAGTLLTLADGSVLRLGRTADWIQLLPRQAISVELPTGPVFGGPISDGTVLLHDGEGRVYSFNPGPAAAVGWRGPAGALVAREGPSIGLGRGLVPRRAARWRLTRDGLEGTQPSDRVELGEWALAVDRRWGDFDLSISAEGVAGAQALLLWDAGPDEFTYVEVGARVRIGRFSGRTPSCPTVEGPAAVTDDWSTVLRVRREGRRVTVEQRGGPSLACTFDGVPGWLGLGVSQGTVTFSGLQVGLP